MDPLQFLHPFELDVVQRGRVSTVAVKQDEAGVAMIEKVHRNLYFLLQAHPRGKNKGLARRTQPVEQREIGQICRGNFIRRNAKLFEDVHATRIPRSAKIKNTFLFAIGGQFPVLIQRQLETPKKIQHILRTEVFTIFAQGALPIDLLQVTHLKLGAISTHLKSDIDHLNGAFKTTVMVVADLGNHTSR